MAASIRGSRLRQSRPRRAPATRRSGSPTSTPAHLILDDRIVPVDGKSNLLVAVSREEADVPLFVGSRRAQRSVAAWQRCKDKIVFVGTTALGTREVVATPLDTLFAGVEVQATVADNLLRAGLHPAPRGSASTLESQIALVLGVALALIVARAGLLLGTIARSRRVCQRCGGEPCGCYRPAACSFRRCFRPLGVVSALAVMTLAKFTIERQRADLAGRRSRRRSA